MHNFFTHLYFGLGILFCLLVVNYNKHFKVLSMMIYLIRSVKTITYESLNNVVRLINGVSAILLAILPGKASILEGIHGWELRPTFRGPRLPRWMEK